MGLIDEDRIIAPSSTSHLYLAADEEAMQREADRLVAELTNTSAETGAHVRRVTRLTIRLGETYNFTPTELATLRYGAFLHDIGKMFTPRHILHKPAALDPDEMHIMRQHPIQGEELARKSGFGDDILRIIRHHHERWDGGGYPDGMVGEQIPLMARLFSIVDAFDAMTSKRCYRGICSPFHIWGELTDGHATQFDPEAVKRFISILHDDMLAATGSDATGTDG